MQRRTALWMIAAAGCGAMLSFTSCLNVPPVATPDPAGDKEREEFLKPTESKPTEHKLATFGGGCFWCTEAVYQQLKGVEKVVSGYSGGHVENPTYDEVCDKKTGHAEVIQVTYDPQVITYPELLEVFWKTHDPTTLNRQGGDSGPQYRSVVFYHDEEQQHAAEHYKEKLDKSGAFGSPIVTEISPYTKFYAAENYHQNYFQTNPEQGYCAAIIRPKVDKFQAAFKDKLKPEYAAP